MKSATVGKKEDMTIKGMHTFSFYDSTVRAAKEAEFQLLRLRERREWVVRTMQGDKKTRLRKQSEISSLFQEWKSVIERFKTGESVVENITTVTGRTSVAQILCNKFGGTLGYVTHCVLGDDSTGEAVGNVALGNETVRKVISDANDNGAQMILETFFGSSEAIGTHEEYGYVIDGGDDDVLLNRFTETKVKSGTQSMNVQSVITIGDA